MSCFYMNSIMYGSLLRLRDPGIPEGARVVSATEGGLEGRSAPGWSELCWAERGPSRAAHPSALHHGASLEMLFSYCPLVQPCLRRGSLASVLRR